MKNKPLMIVIIALIFFGVGVAVGNYIIGNRDNGLSIFEHNNEILKEILMNGHQPLKNESCFYEEGYVLSKDQIFVADYMRAYLIFFSKPSFKKESYISCDGLDNICQLVFSELNVEGDKGQNWILSFKVDPKLKTIINNSFVCVGH